jgi:hypothetical protein
MTIEGKAVLVTAVEAVESLDILINNADLALYDDLSDRATIEQHLAVSLFGTCGVTQSVHAVLTGPVDTDMSRGLDGPKASPESVARAIFERVENGEEDIFPDPLSQRMADSWRGGVAKAMERQNASLVVAEPAAS